MESPEEVSKEVGEFLVSVVDNQDHSGDNLESCNNRIDSSSDNEKIPDARWREEVRWELIELTSVSRSYLQ